MTNNNNALFSAQPAIASNGTLTYTPAANANGTATVTVVVQDSGGTANSASDTRTRTFSITVNAVNDAPVLSTSGSSVLSGSGNTFTTTNLRRSWKTIQRVTVLPSLVSLMLILQRMRNSPVALQG